MNDQEKSETGTKTFVEFCNQFGSDVYALILLEELFKGLIYEETLFVLGQSVETGDQISDCSSEQRCSDISVDGSIDIESTINMGTTDYPDYP